MLKVVLALTALFALVAVVAAKPTEQEARLLFNSWARQHGKSYDTAAEIEQRFAIFRDNLDFVMTHNAEAAQGKHTFTVALNQFGDLTNAEYSRMLTYRHRRHDAPAVHRPKNLGDLPASVDWRDKGVVTPIKNQGQCGSCWSFSAVGSMEGAHALSTGSLVSLSEQNLVDCVANGTCTCDVGGYMQWGFAYVIANGGIEGEADYPYCACSLGKCKFTASKVRATISSYVNVTVDSEDDLQSAVAAQPTVSIAIDASSMAFQFYSSGVFNHPLCGNKFEDLDHGVLAVGYGTLNGVDYWLVKNSWGTTWGQQGYIMMSRNKSNQCGVATDASYPLV